MTSLFGRATLTRYFAIQGDPVTLSEPGIPVVPLHRWGKISKSSKARRMTTLRITALIAFSTLSLFAQTFRGDLSGIVTDASGAALAGASVKVDNPATGQSRSTVTSSAGDYLVAELSAGSYTLTVTMPGFEVRKIENVEISVAKTINIAVQLGVATQQSVVEVSATAVTLETSASALVANVDDKSVQEMPMNGRDFT